MKVRTFILAASLLLMVAAASRAARRPLGDIVFPGNAGFASARFPHWIHRMQYKCYACHDGIFQMKAGADPITMDAILEGKFCGVCHDGKRAFPVAFYTCDRCHQEGK